MRLDWVYPEWNRKAIAFVSFGGVGGARSVQQLRETAIELQLAPIRIVGAYTGCDSYGAFSGRRRCQGAGGAREVRASDD